jgi:DNA-binding MarR family transcriptional regulator
MSRDREVLLRELGDRVRATQRATDLVDEAAAALMGVNRTDGRLLDVLHQHGALSAGALAAESGLTTGAITAAIDRLERAGYARRVRDVADRRRVLVELTEDARRKIWELFGPLAATADKLDQYSESDLELLVAFHALSEEIQQQHAAWLRRRLSDQQSGAA